MKKNLPPEQWEVGRELDEVVAVRIMGWRWWQNRQAMGGMMSRWIGPPDISASPAKGDEPIDDARNRRSVLEYSRFPGAVADVLKQLQTMGFEWELRTTADGGWAAICWKTGKGDQHLFEGSGTFELAIIRAALKAVAQ